MKTKTVPVWVSGIVAVGVFAGLVWAERRKPLRRAVERKLTRNVRNLALAFAGAAALQFVERPIIAPLTKLVEPLGLGLLKQTVMPPWLEVPLAVALMDYTLYIWHRITHRVPWLWRFHLPHHVDLDMDASTALRFHFAELALSVPWRIGQVVLIGISPLSFSVWQTATVLSILFHHSNVQLSVDVERWVNRFIVTPRMHGIHHSTVYEETNSNWSSGLTVWDWLHGTLRLNVPQAEITIGVPAYRDPQGVGIWNVLTMPFRRQRPSWRLPGDGQPAREPLPVPADHLLA